MYQSPQGPLRTKPAPPTNSLDEERRRIRAGLAAAWIFAALLAPLGGIPVLAQPSPPFVSVVTVLPWATEDGSATGEVQFQRAGDPAADLIVSYEVTAGITQAGVTSGATLTDDFTLDPPCAASPCQVTIPAGSLTGTVSVAAAADTADEALEGILFTIPANVAYTAVPPNQANVTIQDDDSPTVTVSAPDPTAGETGPDAGTFRFTLTAATPYALPIRYSIDPLSGATLGADYTFGPTPQLGLVVIPAGSSEADITVLPNDDPLAESSEAVTISLEASPLYNLGAPGTATVGLADNDLPPVSLLVLDAEADEEGGATATLILTRGAADPDAALGVQVTFSSAPGDATLGVDYETDPACPASPCTVAIPMGESSVTLMITALQDPAVESTEPLNVAIAPDAAYSAGTPNSAAIQLLDDDLPLVGVTALDGTAGEPGPNTGTFQLTRSGPTINELRVFLSIASASTAVEGQDYQPIGRTIVIPAGSASADLALTVNDDVVDEPSETAVLALALPPAGEATYSIDAVASAATVTVADNDIPTIGVVASIPGTLEGNGDGAAIRVARLSGDLAVPLTVTYALTGTAALGTDYSVSPACCTVEIPAGDANAFVTIAPSTDSAKEAVETVTAAITASAGYNILSPLLSATIRIVDEDFPSVSVSATDAAGDESGGNTGTFTVTRTGETSMPLVVHYAVGGTAEASDYAPLTGQLTIPAGGASATILVNPVNDPFAEAAETVTASLTATAPHYLVVGGSATVTLVDSDRPLAVVVATPVASEAGPIPGRFVVARLLAEDLSAPLDVKFTVQGTAAANDYTAAPILSGTFTIPAESQTMEILITPTDDGTKEDPETLVLTLRSDAAYSTLGGTNSGTLRIVSEDA